MCAALFRASPLVFCVHGNKWGMAQCCQTLEDDALPSHCHQVSSQCCQTLEDDALPSHSIRSVVGVDRPWKMMLSPATAIRSEVGVARPWKMMLSPATAIRSVVGVARPVKRVLLQMSNTYLLVTDNISDSKLLGKLNSDVGSTRFV